MMDDRDHPMVDNHQDLWVTTESVDPGGCGWILAALLLGLTVYGVTLILVLGWWTP